MASSIYSPKLDPITGFPIHTSPVRPTISSSTPSTSAKVTEIVLFDGSRKEEFYDWWYAVKTAWNRIEVEDEDKHKRAHEDRVNSEYIRLCYAAQRNGQAAPARLDVPPPAYVRKSKEQFLNYIENKLSGYALVWFRQEHHRYSTEVATIRTRYQEQIQAQTLVINQVQQTLQQARQALQNQANQQNQDRVDQE